MHAGEMRPELSSWWQNRDCTHMESLWTSWLLWRAAAFSLAERSRRNRPWGRGYRKCKQREHEKHCCYEMGEEYDAVPPSNGEHSIPPHHSPPRRCLELLAAPLPKSPGGAHWGSALWAGSSVTGFLTAWTGWGPGLWVGGTAGHFHHLRKEEHMGMHE